MDGRQLINSHIFPLGGTRDSVLTNIDCMCWAGKTFMCDNVLSINNAIMDWEFIVVVVVGGGGGGGGGGGAAAAIVNNNNKTKNIYVRNARMQYVQ